VVTASSGAVLRVTTSTADVNSTSNVTVTDGGHTDDDGIQPGIVQQSQSSLSVNIIGLSVGLC